MNILKLELINFQKHEKLVLDFTPNLNIIHGESDVGKSCVIRALSWLYFNEPKGDVIRRLGSDRTSVRIIHDNGIIVERIKSDKENAYILEKDGEQKRFDAIGKSVPSEIKKALGIIPMEVDGEEIILNIAYQLKKPFLLEDSPGFRMKMFNKLTGSEILDLVAQSFNKDILKLGREHKVLDEEVEVKKIDLESISDERVRLDKILAPAMKSFEDVKLRIKRYNEIKDLVNKLGTARVNLSGIVRVLEELILPPEGWIEKFRARIEHFILISQAIEKKNKIEKDLGICVSLLSDIAIPPDVGSLKIRIEKFEKVSILWDGLCSRAGELSDVDEALNGLKVPDNIEFLHSRVERFENVKQLVIALQSKEETGKTIGRDLKVIIEEISVKEGQYKEILKKYGCCPTCKTKVTDKILEGIKL
jgi:DNA repair ATPase RecN